MRINIHSCIFLIFICFSSLFAHAQEAKMFLDVEWDEMRIDSVLPTFSHTIPLGDDYDMYDYQVVMEYPTFEDLSTDEIACLNRQETILPEWPAIDTYIGVEAKQGKLYASLIPLVYREGKYQRITSLKLTPKRTLKKGVLTRASMDEEREARYTSASVLAQGRWVKIRVSESGIYRITYNELRAMGFSSPSRVRLYGHGGQMMAESNIQDCIDDLKEVPLYHRDSDVLFYAHGTISWTRTSAGFVHSQNTYSQYGYYFLTEDASITPMPFPTQESVAGGVAVNTYPDYALHEKDEFSWIHRGRVFFENSSDYKNRDCTFDIPGVVAEQSAKVRVSYGTNDSQSSSVKVLVNGTEVGSISISATSGYTKFQVGEKVFDCKGCLAENSSITLTHLSSATSYLDYIALNFTRQLALRGAFTQFRATSAGKKAFSIANANVSTKVWRIRNEGAKGYSYAEISGSLENNLFQVGDETLLTDEYVVFNASSSAFPSVEVVGVVPNQNLHGMEATDMVIVVPTSAKWMAQAERLADLHRRHDSLRVVVVRADQVYNEFSSGTPDATAIRRFMKMFYDRAQSAEDAPRYLLLFGDCAADNRMVTSEWRRTSPDDFLLCFQSQLSSSETRSYIMEEYFCLLDDNEGTSWTKAKADASVGRLTVRSSAQASIVVDKIEAYLNNREAGVWKNTVCVMGDDGDANRHMVEADKIVSSVQEANPNLVIKKVYWDAFKSENASTGRRFPSVTQRIREISAEGALMMYYTGHGSATSLSHELAWGDVEMKALSSPRLPLWVTAACDTSPIDLPEDNMGETALLNPNAAAIAFLGATRSTYGNNSNPLHILFCKYLFRDGYSMGEALRLAKNNYTPSNAENNLHYILIGDPALHLATPDQYQVKLTSINGVSVDGSELHQFKAGSLVTLKGEIVNADGSRATDFEGLIYPSVYDSKVKVVCNGNDPELDELYEFWDYSRMVYAGSDSVRGGEFTFKFPVPMDISYSEECGNIYFYAQNHLRQEAQGTYGQYFLDGTSENLTSDTIGPAIRVFLNSTDFVMGDRVNETPMLMLALYDENGINATGSSIGHDLIAIIDNDPQKTYVLNSYYTTEPGDYRRGSVIYSLPDLEEGHHTLLVRAWDVLNNSSTVEIPFEVVNGLRPEVGHVWNTPNPARTSTTFVITHNRPQTELTVKIDIYDFSGRLLWNHSQTTVSSGNELRLTWDLTTDGGRPIGNGVYLYRVTLSSENGEEVSKARKIVIARQ